ncbi:site-specific integrase [Maribacter sp. PR1]|uniref:Site-specific integrase n=1 Tax=Maribacter cobaltidurans TaxID=1178778 RepID=A0ABU7IQI9_9FLAO|nr:MULTISPECIES: site-specific integrase [Maribacter]MDC6387541.1 site-specific integrase [Maribacter sp. PR1]MEE1974928.1 site-specific integrase [Maribacter cobaltidurans]
MPTVKRSKGTIRFTFKDSKVKLEKEPKRESLIMMYFSNGKERFKYSTGFYSCYSDWDSQKQRIRNKAHIIDRDYVNDYLNKIESELYREISKMNAQGKPITKEYLTRKLDQITGKNQEADSYEKPNLIEYYSRLIQRKKDKVKLTTLGSHKQTHRLLQEYDNKLDFVQIDHDFYDAFIDFLYSKDFAPNTVGKHIKNLKVVMNSATNEGINTNFLYRQREFKVIKEQTVAIYLDEDEIKRIHELNLSDFPRLEKARDIFLIGCYTGQRVSDYNGLTREDIIKNRGYEFFKIKQKKTGKEVFCPISNEIKEIINAPRNKGNLSLKMNEQDINRYIKEVGRKADINQLIEVSYSKGDKNIVEKRPKYLLIATHTARRSFCTNMFKKGMKPYQIMEVSGHSSEKVFYNYIRIDKEERAVRIAESGFFNI